MNEALSHTLKLGRKPRLWIPVILLLAGVVVLVLLWTPPQPSYGGKRVSAWFEEAVSMSSQQYEGSECSKAFEEMEGDAVPYLVRQVDARPSRLETGWARVQKRLPVSTRKWLPRPRDSGYYRGRRDAALRLLGDIGRDQRLKAAEGQPSVKPPVTLAVPAIRAILQSSNDPGRLWATQTASLMGPAAAGAIPELISLAERDSGYDGGHAIQALGLIGSLASNAVPTLAKIAAATGEKRLFAVQSLGQIGAQARSAVPVLATILLADDNTIPTNIDGGIEVLRTLAARSLAQIGETPVETVPILTAMTQGTNQWARWVAAIALWNRDRENPALRAEVVAGLQSTNRIGVLLTLAPLGTNAAAFVPEIFLQTNDPFSGWAAKYVLRQLQRDSQ